MADFTFYVSLSLSPKFRLSPKQSQKLKSIFSFELTQNFKLSKRLSESLNPKFRLSPKLMWTIRTEYKWIYMQEIG